MPIFKMKCRQCSGVFEYFFKSSSSKAVCPQCNSDDLEKLPSEIAVLSKNTNSCPNAPACPNASPCCCGGTCGGHR
ncbi:MAG: zinc ribbon domain-containing protein [Lentisphaeria bacterium]|nr:zinc ribbon domain-containing protein [Lentisphaeria bacterium]